MTSEGKEALVKVTGLEKHFPIRKGLLIKQKVGSIKAVNGVSFNVNKGETLGLVGESGCGKTTVGRAILQIYRPTAGKVYFAGVDLAKLRGAALRGMRRRMQMIFQDPYASLDPRMTVVNIICEPYEAHMRVNAQERLEKAQELLARVGLDPYFANRYPHEFSGGQRQRIGIARAISAQPEFIVCDEPISALDVSIQAQIVNLLQDLQEQFGLTYLFIAHDLNMVRHISTRIAVMYLGKIVELADRNELYDHPQHPYTKALLSTVPIPDPIADAKRQRIVLEGDVPSAANPPPGCNFHTRCPIAIEMCKRVEPEMREIGPGHYCACHLVQ